MNRHLLATMILGAMLLGVARASDPDVDVIARVTGLQPEVKQGIAKVSVPRPELAVTVDGVKMDPFQGFTSWAAFAGSGNNAVVMGDLTLAEDEVSPVMDAALSNGLEVTALHNHFSFDHPRVLFMHISGMGSTERLATGVHKAPVVRAFPRRTPSTRSRSRRFSAPARRRRPGW